MASRVDVAVKGLAGAVRRTSPRSGGEGFKSPWFRITVLAPSDFRFLVAALLEMTVWVWMGGPVFVGDWARRGRRTRPSVFDFPQDERKCTTFGAGGRRGFGNATMLVNRRSGFRLGGRNDGLGMMGARRPAVAYPRPVRSPFDTASGREGLRHRGLRDGRALAGKCHPSRPGFWRCPPQGGGADERFVCLPAARPRR